MNEPDRIASLEADLTRLKAELETSHENLRKSEDALKFAMDLNELLQQRLKLYKQDDRRP